LSDLHKHLDSSTTHIRHDPDTSPIDRLIDLSREPQSVWGSGRRCQTRPMAEVASKRMRYEDESGWCVEHQGKSIFVADSQWTIASRMDGRLSTILVSTSLRIGPMVMGVSEGSRNLESVGVN